MLNHPFSYERDVGDDRVSTLRQRTFMALDLTPTVGVTGSGGEGRRDIFMRVRGFGVHTEFLNN